MTSDPLLAGGVWARDYAHGSCLGWGAVHMYWLGWDAVHMAAALAGCRKALVGTGLSKKGGIGGGGRVSALGAMHMAAALAGCRKALVGTGLSISLHFDTNGRS